MVTTLQPSSRRCDLRHDDDDDDDDEDEDEDEDDDSNARRNAVEGPLPLRTSWTARARALRETAASTATRSIIARLRTPQIKLANMMSASVAPMPMPMTLGEPVM